MVFPLHASVSSSVVLEPRPYPHVQGEFTACQWDWWQSLWGVAGEAGGDVLHWRPRRDQSSLESLPHIISLEFHLFNAMLMSQMIAFVKARWMHCLQAGLFLHKGSVPLQSLASSLVSQAPPAAEMEKGDEGMCLHSKAWSSGPMPAVFQPLWAQVSHTWKKQIARAAFPGCYKDPIK